MLAFFKVSYWYICTMQPSLSVVSGSYYQPVRIRFPGSSRNLYTDIYTVMVSIQSLNHPPPLPRRWGNRKYWRTRPSKTEPPSVNLKGCRLDVCPRAMSPKCPQTTQPDEELRATPPSRQRIAREQTLHTEAPPLKYQRKRGNKGWVKE